MDLLVAPVCGRVMFGDRQRAEGKLRPLAVRTRIFVLHSKQTSAPLLVADNVQRLRDEVKAAEEILPRLVDRAAALYLLAHHYAR
jgi:hypothetical protein